MNENENENEFIQNIQEGKKIKLITPIMKNGEKLTHIVLRKPNSGNLRGLSLVSMCNMDFDSAMIIIPRISILNERDILNVEVENLAPLLTGLASFFVNTKQ